MRLPLTVPLLFITIPALLGAWINGKREAFRWAAFAVLMSLLSSISTSPPEFMQLRLNAGLFGAQGIVLFVTCYFVGTLADQQRREQAELEKANRQLAEQALVREQLATARERVRLARDLHDTLAHTLAGLVVQSKVVDTLLEKDPVAARRELVRVQAVAKEGLEEARAAIGDLRANVVEDLGLNGAIRRMTETTGQRTGMQVSVQETGDEVHLDKQCAEILFRIVQEALNNVERHARAQHINVSITQTLPPDRTLTIGVKDDGVGFNVAALDDERFGLRGMRERAELIGAHLRLDSMLGAGTTVTVTLKQHS
jgi:signal transduction histidine kinase